MPSTLTTRRERAFRPTRFSERHQEVAILIASGLRRNVIAQRTGYTPSHISRIGSMPEVRLFVCRALANDAARSLEDRTRELVQR